MKSHLRFSKASESTKRKIESIIRLGERNARRKFRAVDRAPLRALLEGGPTIE
jgi:hypothetical protein